MSEVSHVQWFPGHMAKTRRIMASNLKLVDAVVEITDARIPFSSRNPEMKRIVGSKPRLVLLNKADSADPGSNGNVARLLCKTGYHSTCYRL